MSDNVVPLGSHIITSVDGEKPSQELIDMLRELLAEAERGDIHGAAIVAVSITGNYNLKVLPNCPIGSLLGGTMMMWENVKAMFTENAIMNCRDDEPQEPEPA